MTRKSNTAVLQVIGMSVVTLSLLVSVVCADRVIGPVHNDSLTTFLGDPSSVHGVRPLVWQRGKGLDGSPNLPSLQYATEGPGQPTAPPSVGGDGPAGAPGVDGPERNFCSVGGGGPATQGQTAGVDGMTGGFGPFEVDLSLPAEVPWSIGRTYNAVQRDGSNDPMDSHGYQGVNWMQTSQPELVFYDDPGTDADDLIYVMLGAGTFLEYKRTGTGEPTFQATNGGGGGILIDSTTYDESIAMVYAPSGQRMDFFWFGDGDTDDDVEGQLWRISSPSGVRAYVGDELDPGDAITNGYNTTTGAIEVAFDSAGRRFTYTYDTTAIGGVYHLEQVLVEIDSGGWTEIARVDYTYYVNADDYGQDGDLKTASITTQGMDAGGDLTMTKYFRYYEAAYDDEGEETNLGHPHMLMMVVDFEGVRSFDWDEDGALDAGYLTATTDDLKPYASAFLEYNEDRMVHTIWHSGACGCSGGADGAFTFTYEDNGSFSDDAGYDDADADWYARVIITQPDGQFVTQYFDEVGQTLSRVITDTLPSGSPTKTWATFVDRDANGAVIKVNSPANVTTYTHSTGSFTRSTTVGLVTSYSRVSSGDATGLVQHMKHQEGNDVLASKYLDRSYFYETKEFELVASGPTVTRALVDVAWTYEDPTTTEATSSSGPSGSKKTATARTYHTGGASVLRPMEGETTLPAVDSGKNGSGSALKMTSYTRKAGTLAFSKDAEGRFTYTESENGQIVKRIVDAKTNATGVYDQDPNGVFGITETGDGLHEVMTFTYDDLGRRITATTYDADGTTIDRVTRQYATTLADGRIMSLSYPKYVSGSGTFYGPVSFSVRNHAGRVEAQGLIAVTGDTTTETLDDHVDEAQTDPVAAITNGAGAIGDVVRLTVNVYDQPGSQLQETRSYYLIPGSLPGAEGTNYDATTFAYDNAGRRIRTLSPTGTIQRTVYDTKGRASEQWVGTDDADWGDPMPTHNMVKVSENTYDGGSSGGNSLLTKVTAYIEDSPTGKRETTFTHDVRGRVLLVTNEEAPHTFSKYDNMGRLIASGQFSSVGSIVLGTDDPTTETANRLALHETFYDELGRVWKTVRHKIDASDGSSDDTLVALTWYDADGRVIKVDGEQLTKTFYDRLGRATHQFVLASTNDSAYADADDVSGDIVLEEHQTVYDPDTGEVIMTASIERFHNDFGGGETTGALDTNADGLPYKYTAANLEGRIQISASWFDDLGRMTDTVSFGTYSGSDFNRSGLSVPSRSDTALRTTYSYSADGTLLEVADPLDNKTRYVYDDLGRQVAVIANYVDGTPSGPTGDDDVYTRFIYTNGLRTTLWVDLDGSNTVDSGDQVTTYTYGTTKGTSAGDSTIATGHLLSKVTYPAQVSMQDPDDRSTLHAYNAQSQLIWMQDHEGNVMEYNYDDMGRMAQQRVTTLGGSFDNAVLRIATTYDSLSRRELVTQYNNATPGSGSVVNEVQFTYDGWGNLESFDQDHDSTVATATDYIYSVGYAYETAGAGAAPDNGRNTLRRTQMTLPNGAEVIYDFSSTHNLHDQWASRVTYVKVDHDGTPDPLDPPNDSPITVASYWYNGSGHVVSTDYPEPDVMNLSYAIGSPNAYGNLDIFNRVVTSAWTKDLGTDHEFFEVNVFYDAGSNITRTEDKVLGGWDHLYAIDGLNRLVQAERGTWDVGDQEIDPLKFDQQWTLDQVGNWDVAKLDRNGDTDFVDTGDYNDDRTHNDVNELKARDTDDNGSDNYTLTYFKTGALNNDGQHYKYVWDGFGRLRKVLNRSNDNLVAEYTYNGLGFRISEHFDTDTDGDVDGSDSTYHFVFDERWRIVATYRDDDADPKELFVHHAAGAGGYGTSSYIDAVILREVDLSTDWDVEADALDARHYYCQNWRADVSVIIDDSATIIERVMYSPYGVPFGVPAGDLVTSSSFAQPTDGIVDGADSAVMLGAYSGSWNYADLDNDGDVDSDDLAVLSANWGDNLGWGLLSNHHNRFGYAGYVFDEALAGTKWHVRHRVLESVLGRWISRDPLGYVDGMNVSVCCGTNPMKRRDPHGQVSWEQCHEMIGFDCWWSPAVRHILANWPAGCPIPTRAEIRCSGCIDVGPGVYGFTFCGSPEIYLCFGRVPTLGALCETLAHELQHKADECLAIGPCNSTSTQTQRCLDLACTEIRASALSGQCCLGGFYRDPSESYGQCVKRSAANSVASWAICSDNPDDYVYRQMPRCLADLNCDGLLPECADMPPCDSSYWNCGDDTPPIR